MRRPQCADNTNGSILDPDLNIAAHAPIVMFDSGVGGLTVLAELRKLLPEAPVIYAADMAGLPYGTKSEAEIAARVCGLLGRMGAEDHRQVERAIALTHTERFADRLVDTLSGGERGRVWLAMLLAQESRFILLDEPLAALDVAHQVEVLTLVKQLSRQLNLGVIIVIHDINMASRFCDRLVALHSGRLLTHGEPEQIMTGETLNAIYGIPMEVIRHPAHDHAIAIV